MAERLIVPSPWPLSLESTMRRAWIAAATAAWLAAGLAGAAAYVHGYDLHRGFAPPRTPAGVPRGTLRVVAFPSAAIGRTEQYLVYLPAGYAAAAARGRRFPVLYLLHGAPGRMTSFTDVGAAQVAADTLIARHRIRPLIMVMPAAVQGFRGDTEWANRPAGRWMDDVIAVVHDVDRRFATRADRQDRGIGGDSEGAYGAVNVALHHLDLFSVVESWSGYYWQTRSTVFAHAPAAEIRANSPGAYIGALAPRIHRIGLRAWLYQGLQDHTDRAQLRAFAAALRAAGADVRLAFFPGGHDWGLWRRETPRMLIAAARWFGSPARAAAGQRVAVGQALAPRARASRRPPRGVRRPVVIGRGQQVHQHDRQQHVAGRLRLRAVTAAGAQRKEQQALRAQPRVAPGT